MTSPVAKSGGWWKLLWRLLPVIIMGIKLVTANGIGVEQRPMGTAAPLLNPCVDSMNDNDAGTANKRGALKTPDASLGVVVHPSLKAGKGAAFGQTEGGVVVWCPLAFCSARVVSLAGVN